jgi:hypothetical protein
VSTSCSRAEVDSIYLFSGITIIFWHLKFTSIYSP